MENGQAAAKGTNKECSLEVLEMAPGINKLLYCTMEGHLYGSIIPTFYVLLVVDLPRQI